MTFPGRSFKSFVLRAMPKRRNNSASKDSAIDWSELGLDAVKEHDVETSTTDIFITGASVNEPQKQQDAVEDSFIETGSLTDDETSPGEVGEFPGEDSPADQLESPDEGPGSSLAGILRNAPPPPAVSVDNLISDSLGSIFQKRVSKDPTFRALLDGQEEIDMRALASELKQFAIEIGASK